MKRINMRTARRAPGQPAPEPVVGPTTFVDCVTHVDTSSGVRVVETVGGPGWGVNEAAWTASGDFDDYQRPTRQDALVALRMWFRRNRPGYIGGARVQEFGNEQPATGRVIQEMQTCRYQGGSVQAEAMLLDFSRDRQGEITTLPQFLGMRIVGDDEFIFETALAVAVLARYVVTKHMESLGFDPRTLDKAFLQVTREYDQDIGGGLFQQSARFFARVRTYNAAQGFSDVVMVETEADDWMNHQTIAVRAYDMARTYYEPTRWERFCEFFKSKRSKARDIRREEKVRFVQRARTNEWHHPAGGYGCALRPHRHDI